MAMRGVNLGGWLVLEGWITPSLFEGTTATDEFTLCEQFGNRAAAQLNDHRQTFITEADFAWLAAHGIEAVRLPVGYWIFGDEPPFVDGLDYVDQAFAWAQKHNLKVLLDLHGAPGSQNGWDHSGRSGLLGWHTQQRYIDRTVNALVHLATRYGAHPQLWGIEVLNEPRWDVPKKILARFYESAYAVIREHAPESVAVVISDSFRPHDWNRVLAAPTYKNVVLDRHFYQCFDDRDKALDMPGHLHKARSEWRAEVQKLQQRKPVIAGEWSLALDGISNEQDWRSYADAQLEAFVDCAAWFFWTYKTEDSPEWDLRRSAKLLGLQPE